MSLGLNILLIFVFLVIGSVFSGTELALVSLRGSQIEQMEQEDARGAKVAKIARDPNTFLSTVQIGVTLSGFLSASFGASSIAPYLIPVVESWGVHPGIAGGLVNIILTLIISYCSIVISEMVPKRIAMQRTEQIARAVVPAIDAFAAVCRPIIWLIGKNTNGIVRLLGFDPQQTESEVSDDELRVLVSSNTNLSKDERTILDDVFDASETIVAEVMRPRADVVFIEGDQPLAEAAASCPRLMRRRVASFSVWTPSSSHFSFHGAAPRIAIFSGSRQSGRVPTETPARSGRVRKISSIAASREAGP